jgi:hypothetical protein
MQIAKIRKIWPRLELPDRPAAIRVLDVLHGADGTEKDEVIRQWMAAVWESWADRQARVRETTDVLLSAQRGER